MQERIVQGRGQQGARSSAVQDSDLVSAVASSNVLRVQRDHKLHKHDHCTGSEHATAVLEVVLQHMASLMQERLLAAQMLLPDIPLVSAVRTEQQLEHASAAGKKSKVKLSFCVASAQSCMLHQLYCCCDWTCCVYRCVLCLLHLPCRKQRY